MKMNAKEFEKAMEFLSLDKQAQLDKLQKQKRKLQMILLIGRFLTVAYVILWAFLLYASFQYNWSSIAFGIILIGGIIVFLWLLRFFVVGIAARYSRERDGGPCILSDMIYMVDVRMQDILRNEDKFTKTCSKKAFDY